MEKKDFYEVIDETGFGNCRILIDKKNHWGPLMNRKQAEEEWSRFKNSGLSFKEWTELNY